MLSPKLIRWVPKVHSGRAGAPVTFLNSFSEHPSAHVPLGAWHAEPHMISFSGACHQTAPWKPKVDFLNTLFWKPERRRVPPAPVSLRKLIEHVDVTMNLARFWIIRKSLDKRSSQSRRRQVLHSTVLSRAHGMADLLWGVPQWPTGMKSVEFLEVFYSLEVSKHRSGCSPRSPASLPVIYK